LRKRAIFLIGAAILAIGMLGAVAPAGATGGTTSPSSIDGHQFFLHHGYRPLKGLDVLQKTKAAAARWVALHHPQAAKAPSFGAAPGIGASWSGLSNAGVSPPDPNGAIGPNSYIEIINQNIGIYNRTGGLIVSATLSSLTGHGAVSDPMILWDPDTQRFYYNVWDTSQSTMEWGFSKTDNPTTLPSGFCNYTASFGYNPSSDIPDYPKLGQTKEFLMIGVNHYPSFSSMHADRSDLLWIQKPQGQAPVTTCPAQATFGTGLFTNLRNQGGTQAFTPVPAIQTDPSSRGFVVTMSDIECPDICGNGTKITVHVLLPDPSNPSVPRLLTTGKSITVASYTSPPDAPQKSTTNTLDTLDGRLTHAVSGKDPSHGNNLAIWVSHSVMGGAGSQINWYEINPVPFQHPSLYQSGTVSDSSLWVFNSGISSDRAVTAAGTGSHGDAMVLGFTTSSSSTFPADQMVSKIGTGAQSAFVLVHQATTFDNDFTCRAPFGPPCRWGDYGGATPDPAADPLAAHGEVWLSNDTTNGTNTTWNWEALP
jgi:hypothetical protein